MTKITTMAPITPAIIPIDDDPLEDLEDGGGGGGARERHEVKNNSRQERFHKTSENLTD